MANCVKCGKTVGCGCELTNGLCQTCYQASIVPTKKV